MIIILCSVCLGEVPLVVIILSVERVHQWGSNSMDSFDHKFIEIGWESPPIQSAQQFQSSQTVISLSTRMFHICTYTAYWQSVSTHSAIVRSVRPLTVMTPGRTPCRLTVRPPSVFTQSEKWDTASHGITLRGKDACWDAGGSDASACRLSARNANRSILSDATWQFAGNTLAVPAWRTYDTARKTMVH
jgi:hypothetical protein